VAKFVVGTSGKTLRSAPVGIVGAKVRPGQRLLGRSPLPPQGTRPAFPGSEPEYRPLVPCYTQKLPELNGPLSQGPPDGTG
jgi:hypothetical protein